jgi:hypothetical protein
MHPGMSRSACWLASVLVLGACGPVRAEPEPSAPPDCSAPTAGDIESLARAHGIAARQIHVPANEARAQARRHPGEVCLDLALAAALHSLFHDRDDPDSAASMLDRYGREFARHPQSMLGLARAHHEPPRGERMAEAWLFVLTMPALSDHQYWAVVHRRRNKHGRVVVYSYGFN